MTKLDGRTTRGPSGKATRGSMRTAIAVNCATASALIGLFVYWVIYADPAHAFCDDGDLYCPTLTTYGLITSKENPNR